MISSTPAFARAGSADATSSARPADSTSRSTTRASPGSRPGLLGRGAHRVRPFGEGVGIELGRATAGQASPPRSRPARRSAAGEWPPIRNGIGWAGRRQAEHALRERVALARASGRSAGPAVTGDLHPLDETAAAILERNVEGVELLAQPAGADPELESPAACDVDRRGLLREDHRMPEREDEHRRAQSRALGRRGHQRQRDESVDVRRRRRPGRAAVGGEGVMRLDRGRQDDVVADPERLEPGGLQPRGHRRNPHLEGQRAAVRNERADAHRCRSPGPQRATQAQARMPVNAPSRRPHN